MSNLVKELLEIKKNIRCLKCNEISDQKKLIDQVLPPDLSDIVGNYDMCTDCNKKMEKAIILSKVECPNNIVTYKYTDCDMNGHSEEVTIKIEPTPEGTYIVRSIWNMTGNSRDNCERKTTTMWSKIILACAYNLSLSSVFDDNMTIWNTEYRLNYGSTSAVTQKLYDKIFGDIWKTK